MNFKKMNLFALCLLVLWGLNVLPAYSQAKKASYHLLKVYHLEDESQEAGLDKYLEQAYLPALHRAGVKNVGVFKPAENSPANASDTTQLVYVFIPLTSQSQFFNLDETLAKDKQYLAAGKEYINATQDKPLYSRFENILIEGFTGMPGTSVPKLKGPKKDRIYELRSYESASEKLHLNKVDMFNNGEVEIFDNLGFNAVFYGRVLAGSKMPNLMYMTTFENKEERDKHWKAFSADPTWKKMSSDPKYAKNVSKNDTYFLYPTDYSDF
ncbi:NIPSNAP family protein [Pontibacter russatus]|uniref:NIPSNAP family protein n=1 Tax=Pontibacter russatus TaxID=2694929 RepID=UPI0013798FA4|nr:NIPSNAP family protein [Pontibacter russatus]